MITYQNIQCVMNIFISQRLAPPGTNNNNIESMKIHIETRFDLLLEKWRLFIFISRKGDVEILKTLKMREKYFRCYSLELPKSIKWEKNIKNTYFRENC